MREDPFYAVKAKIQTLISQVLVDYDKFKDTLQNRNTAQDPHFQTLLRTLRVNCKSIRNDLRALNTTVEAVVKHRSNPVFAHITDSELASRRKFITETTSIVDDIDALMTSQKTRSKIERDSQIALTASEPPSSYASARERQNYSDTNDFIESKRQEHQALVAREDEALDDMSSALARLSDMGHDIETGLKETQQGLDVLDEEVDSANRLMSIAMRRLDRLLGKSSWGKYCCIFMLVIIMILLFLAVIYL